jgi:hypothetical protein
MDSRAWLAGARWHRVPNDEKGLLYVMAEIVGPGRVLYESCFVTIDDDGDLEVSCKSMGANNKIPMPNGWPNRVFYGPLPTYNGELD